MIQKITPRRSLRNRLPALAEASRRPAVVAEILAGDEAWAFAIAVEDLPREAGRPALVQQMGRAATAQAWRG